MSEQICPFDQYYLEPEALKVTSIFETTLSYSVTDYIGISGSSHSCGAADLHSRYCGNSFATDAGTKVVDATSPTNVICDCTAPFAVEIHTDATAVKNDGTAVAADADLPTAGSQRGKCPMSISFSCKAFQFISMMFHVIFQVYV